MATLTPPAPVTLRSSTRCSSRSRTGAAGVPTTSSARSTTSRPEKVARGGRAWSAPGARVSMAIPINKVAGPDNPNPAIHYRQPGARHRHQLERPALRHRLPRHGLPRRLPHPCRRAVPRLLQGPDLQRQAGPGGPDLARARPRSTSQPTATGLVGRGVLLDAAAVPRRQVARAGRGGHPRRARGDREGAGRDGSARATSSSSAPATTGAGSRSARGATSIRRPARARPACTSTPCPGCTSGGSPRSCPTATARPCPATSRACSIRSTPCRSRPWACARPTACSSRTWPSACEAEGRFEFMVVGLPLRLPGGTGSPWNPIAIF